jgi:hypothetical protein
MKHINYLLLYCTCFSCSQSVNFDRETMVVNKEIFYKKKGAVNPNEYIEQLTACNNLVFNYNLAENTNNYFEARVHYIGAFNKCFFSEKHSKTATLFECYGASTISRNDSNFLNIQQGYTLSGAYTPSLYDFDFTVLEKNSYLMMDTVIRDEVDAANVFFVEVKKQGVIKRFYFDYTKYTDKKNDAAKMLVDYVNIVQKK